MLHTHNLVIRFVREKTLSRHVFTGKLSRGWCENRVAVATGNKCLHIKNILRLN